MPTSVIEIALSNFVQHIFDFYLCIKGISISEERRIFCQLMATSPEKNI
jgi:hypothetical protein